MPVCLMAFPSLNSFQPSRSSVAQSARSSTDLMPCSAKATSIGVVTPGISLRVSSTPNTFRLASTFPLIFPDKFRNSLSIGLSVGATHCRTPIKTREERHPSTDLPLLSLRSRLGLWLARSTISFAFARTLFGYAPDPVNPWLGLAFVQTRKRYRHFAERNLPLFCLALCPPRVTLTYFFERNPDSFPLPHELVS